MDTSPSPLDSAAQLSRYLRKVAKDERYSTLKLAQDTGIPYSTLRRKLNGVGDFTFTELAAIADQLKIKTSQLVAAAETATQKKSA